MQGTTAGEAEGTPVDSQEQPVKGAAETRCSTAHEESPVGGDENESVKESSCSLALPEGTPVDSHKQPVKGAAEIPCPTVNASAGTSCTFAAKSRRPKDIKRLQGRVCKYKKTLNDYGNGR
ncbi:hypothetical protein HPB52_000097 [Rhipicephalus sanguineus]|uniref:Uncharacterized protein n=1 Tax=Rhipicephalus sanguineus TaxID=34632 RepID=A0A9D4PVU5_RHISA|nr:hypothetical protein HPB52_000097 [Rhipicephalus sanguineus]